MIVHTTTKTHTTTSTATVRPSRRPTPTSSPCPTSSATSSTTPSPSSSDHDLDFEEDGGGVFGVFDASSWQVTDQDPQAGAHVDKGTVVVLQIERS